LADEATTRQADAAPLAVTTSDETGAPSPNKRGRRPKVATPTAAPDATAASTAEATPAATAAPEHATPVTSMPAPGSERKRGRRAQTPTTVVNEPATPAPT